MASLGVAVLRFDNVTYAHRREVKKAHDYQLWSALAVMGWSRTSLLKRSSRARHSVRSF
jgi:hypothetical protein